MKPFEAAPRKLRSAIVLIALLSLVACMREPELASDDGGKAAIPPPVVSANEAAPATGSDGPMLGAATLKEIPARFVGRWGLGEADCDPAKADIAKGLMAVEPTRLVFYESRGTASRIGAEGPDRLRLVVDYSGEGQEWTHDVVLTLSDGGKTLTRDEPKADTGTLTYKRCPAGAAPSE
jgi:hypothetical protein